MTDHIIYTAPKTLSTFMKSQSFGRIVAGPVGSGKTTACIFELFRRACEQPLAPNGVRRTRFAVVRQTLSQLKHTVLKDILYWLERITHYKVSENTIYIEAGDVRSEWILIPLEDPEDQRRLLSMQLTGAWISEAIETDVGLVPALSARCGRYPSTAMGGPPWYGIIADTNMPSMGSPWHKFMTEAPPDWQMFIQPGGMEPDAENLENLPGQREYYERSVRDYGNESDWCRRYVHAQFGDDPSGLAVFKDTFKHHWHVADEVLPVTGHPLLIGQDFGRNPCSIICQADHKGRLLVLEEVMADNIGLQLHVERNLRPALALERYTGRSRAIVGDPAGAARGQIYEETSFDALKRLGFTAFPAATTNDLDRRLRAVDHYLLGARDAGPAILFDRERCPVLIRGMSGGYRYTKTRQGVLKPVPDKSDPHGYSHICDALQYACMAAHGGMADFITRRFTPKKFAPAPSAQAWA